MTCKDGLTALSQAFAKQTSGISKLPETNEAEKSEKTKQKESLYHDVANAVGAAETLGLCLSERSPLASQYTAKLRLVTERDRVDKQAGAGSSSGGSTSAVSSGSVPALLGLALESGAITNSVNGNTVTYRSTPAKLIAAVAKVYGKDSPTGDRAYGAMSKIDLGLSFSTSNSGSTTSNSGTTLQSFFKQVSEISARYEIINHRDVFSSDAFKLFTALRTSKESQEYLKSAGKLFGSLYAHVPGTADIADKGYAQWYQAQRKQLVDKIADGNVKTDSEILKLLTDYFDQLAKDLADDPNFKAALDEYIDNWVKESQKAKAIYGKVAKSPILTAEYAFDRPPMVMAQTGTSSTPPSTPGVPPNVHNARLILAARFIGDSEYTLNASAGFFDKASSGMNGHWRDLQSSAKLDIPLPTIPGVGKGTLTFSGLYLHLHQRPLGIDLKVNDVTINQAGNIGLFQAKYSLPLGDSGVSVPLSLTVSNRTELIKESKVHGNFGITFDLDKLFAKGQKPTSP